MALRYGYWALAFIALLAVAGFCMPARAQNAASTPADPVPTLSFVDAENGSILFNLADITRFDWDRQLFELSPARATELLALPVVQRRDFAVKDREGIIYRGRFYRSSTTEGEGYDGSTILIDQGPLKQLPASPFFTISGGYPTADGAHKDDRFSPRLQAILAQAGKLSTITDAELPVQRLWSGHTWVGGEQVLKASAVLFPNTFHVGKFAYLHLLLFKGQHPDFAYDKMVVVATCRANEGNFQSKQDILSITPPLIDNGIYVCKFRPWEGVITPSTDEDHTLPQLKSGAQPRYPKDALNDDREGVATVAVQINIDGKVSDVTLEQPSGIEDIDRAVTRAVAKMVFTPAIANGKAVNSMLKLQYRFSDRKVQQTILPPEPIIVTAKPGPMDLSLEIIVYKKEGETYTPTGTWPLPARIITLLPADDVAASTPKP